VKALGYRILAFLGRHLGVWVVAAFAACVAAGYFVLLPARRRQSLAFYRALLPQRSPGSLLALTWRQYLGFASVFAERLRLAWGAPLAAEVAGFDALQRCRDEGRGAVLIMSHLGSWELAARLLRREGLRLMLFMGARAAEQIERLQKADLARDGVAVHAVQAGQGSAFGLVEGLQFLRDGGFVSLAGDRSLNPEAKRLRVQMLGHALDLPATPWALAQAAGVPVFHFFALRLAPGRYRIWASGPHAVPSAPRAERALRQAAAAQAYADELSQVARDFPEQWYTFGEFLGARGEGREG